MRFVWLFMSLYITTALVWVAQPGDCLFFVFFSYGERA